MRYMTHVHEGGRTCGGFTYKSITHPRSVHAHGQTISYCLAIFRNFFGVNREEQDIAVWASVAAWLSCWKETGTRTSVKGSIIVCRLSASPNNALAHAMSSASVILLAVGICFFEDQSSGNLMNQFEGHIQHQKCSLMCTGRMRSRC
jgi:hypothetical protein